MTEIEIWRYAVPPGTTDGYRDCGGVFMLDSTGFFSCVTDYGNYAFRWTAFGPDFRAFLTQLEPHYLASKLGTHDTWDEGAVEQHLRNVIGESQLDDDDKANLLDTVSSAASSEFDFGIWFATTVGEVLKANEAGAELDDVIENFPKKTYRGDLLAFCDRLWPRFIALLQQDLATRQSPATTAP